MITFLFVCSFISYHHQATFKNKLYKNIKSQVIFPINFVLLKTKNLEKKT